MPPVLADLVLDVEQRSPTAAPLDLLATASLLAEELRGLSDEVLSHFVARCRDAGHTWSEIGGSLGVTKQAVQKRFSGRDPFERFTARARRVVEEHAVEAARWFGHAWIGTEHLLIGLWGEPDGVAAAALGRLRVDRQRVIEAVVARVPTGPPPDDRTPGAGERAAVPAFTPRAWNAVERAASEAVALAHNMVGTEHLLLALVGGVGGVAEAVLHEQGADHDQVQRVVVELLGGATS